MLKVRELCLLLGGEHLNHCALLLGVAVGLMESHVAERLCRPLVPPVTLDSQRESK